MSDCQHLGFESRIAVFRLTEVEGGPATRFTAEIHIRCVHCKMVFRFLGLPGGLMFDRPTVDPWGEELRAPIEPAPELPTWGERPAGHT